MSYWRSFDDLERYARAKDHEHFPAWVRFYKEVGFKENIGIWHETFMVHAGEYEVYYGNMPKFGLGNAHEVNHIHIQGRSHARDRSGQADQAETLEAPELG